MKIKPQLYIFSFLLCLSSQPLFAVNKALLIGVGEYLGTKDDLEGPKHDVPALKQTLLKHWHFKPENITTLIDYDATRANVLSALTSLKDNAKKENLTLVTTEKDFFRLNKTQRKNIKCLKIKLEIKNKKRLKRILISKL